MLLKNIANAIINSVKIANETSLHKNLKHVVEQNMHTNNALQKFLFDVFKSKAKLKSYSNKYPYLSKFENLIGYIDLFLLNHKVFLIFKVDNENFFVHLEPISKDREQDRDPRSFDEKVRDETVEYIDSLKDQQKRKERTIRKQIEYYNFVKGNRAFKTTWRLKNGEYGLLDVKGNTFTFKILEESKTSSMEEDLDRIILKIKERIYDIVKYEVIDDNYKTIAIGKGDKEFYLKLDTPVPVSNFAVVNKVLYVKTKLKYKEQDLFKFKINKEIEIQLIDTIDSLRKLRTQKEEELNIENLEKNN